MEVAGFDLQAITNGVLTVVGTILVWIAGKRGLNYARSETSKPEVQTTIVDSIAANHMKIVADALNAQYLEMLRHNKLLEESNEIHHKCNNLKDRHNDNLTDISRALADLSKELARRH